LVKNFPARDLGSFVQFNPILDVMTPCTLVMATRIGDKISSTYKQRCVSAYCFIKVWNRAKPPYARWHSIPYTSCVHASTEF